MQSFSLDPNQAKVTNTQNPYDFGNVQVSE